MPHDLSYRFHSGEVPPKQIWLGAVFTAFSLAYWFLIFRMFSGSEFDVPHLAGAAAFGFAWTLMLAFTILFVQKRFAYLLYAINIVWLLILFGFTTSNLIAVAIFATALWFGYVRGGKTQRKLADFSLWMILRKSLTVVFSGLALFLAFSFNSMVIGEEYKDDLEISPEVFNAVFAPVDSFLNVALPGYAKGGTVGDFQESLLRGFASDFLPERQNIDTNEIQQLEQETLQQNQLLDEAALEQPLREFARQRLNDFIKTSLAPYEETLPVFFVAALFAVMRVLLWPLMWLYIIFIVVAIKLLLLYNILDIKQVEIVKEVPVLE